MSNTPRFLIDARPLIDPRGGGVRNVAEQIVKSILDAGVHADYYFVTTGFKKISLPDWIMSDARAHHIHLPWPNKAWSAAAMLGVVTIDGEAAKQLPTEEHRPKKFDKVLILNLGFTGFIETPYALLLHDLSFVINPAWFTLKARLWHIAVNPKELIRRAQKLFSVSETTARDAERIYGATLKETGIVRPGVRESRLVNESMSQSVKEDDRRQTTDNRQTSDSFPTPYTLHPTPFLLVLGAGNPRKNVPTAIKAFEILKREPEFSNLKLIVIGSSRITNNESRITNAEYLPPQSDPELDSLYANASIFLYPSWYEGYGLPLHEAARFGTPCIASTDGALPETAPEGTVFVPPSKPHLWVKAMRDVLSSPEQYRTIFNPEQEKPDFKAIINWLLR